MHKGRLSFAPWCSLGPCIPSGVTFKILTILDTGTVKLKRYLEDGSLDNKILVSKFEVFTRKYKLTKTVRHLMDNWPAGDVGDQFSSELVTAQALAQFLVVENYKANKRPSVTIQGKPRVGVFVEEAWKKGQFKLPIYGKVGCDSESEGVPSKTFEVKGVRVKGMVFFVKPSIPKDDGLVAASFIHYDADASVVNVDVEWKVVEVPFGKKKYKASVPIIVNQIPLKKGDEIVLKKEVVEKGGTIIKRQIALSCASSSKKQKIDG
jgi:hypothetical protein